MSKRLIVIGGVVMLLGILLVGAFAGGMYFQYMLTLEENASLPPISHVGEPSRYVAPQTESCTGGPVSGQTYTYYPKYPGVPVMVVLLGADGTFDDVLYLNYIKGEYLYTTPIVFPYHSTPRTEYGDVVLREGLGNVFVLGSFASCEFTSPVQ